MRLRTRSDGALIGGVLEDGEEQTRPSPPRSTVADSQPGTTPIGREHELSHDVRRRTQPGNELGEKIGHSI